MTDGAVMTLGSETFLVAAKLAAPLLGCALLVGVVVSLLQAATQVQEMTLTFVPKIAALAVVLVLVGPWMLRSLMDFTIELFLRVPEFAH
ncbi:MAG: flagellar biosynthesis protein FliQ [Armatimonadota bacterium]